MQGLGKMAGMQRRRAIFAEYYHDFRRPFIITGNKIHTKGPGKMP